MLSAGASVLGLTAGAGLRDRELLPEELLLLLPELLEELLPELPDEELDELPDVGDLLEGAMKQETT